MHGTLTLDGLRESMRNSTRVTCMVFVIFIGASIFSLIFRGFGGEELVTEFLLDLPGGRITAFFVVMLLMFLLGFFLDFIEIVFVVVPIVAPILLQMDMDPIWLGVMIAVNLQTSFLTPTLRVRIVLPARGGAAFSCHIPNLQRSHSVRLSAAVAAGYFVGFSPNW